MARLQLPYLPPSSITSESVWQSRRQCLAQLGFGALGLTASKYLGAAEQVAATEVALTDKTSLFQAPRNVRYSVDDTLTSFEDISSYNNFYEFGTGKGDPARYAPAMKTRPWTVSIEGEVMRPRTFDIDDLLKLAPLEERVYRLRCVEAWSMVIPWSGYPLAKLLAQVQPTNNARYVEFVTALEPEVMPGVHTRILDWPYVEALRIDEAVHPLTLLVFGVYGKPLPNANGAPLRIAVPWKYGFKSAKSIVRIRLLEKQPLTSWTKAASREYGFYANVNPDVPHPRWSQATERIIGSGLFARRVPTRMYNGYGDQVASLYSGMDLSRYY